MARGLPDYFNPDTVVAQRLLDVGQVVTALIGTSMLDGRGHLVWFDNFREGLAAWYLYSANDGTNPTISTAYAFVPPASVAINHGTWAGTGKSYLERYLHIAAAGRVGIDLALLRQGDDITYGLIMAYDTGLTRKLAILYLDDITGIVTISSGGAERAIATLSNPGPNRVWEPIKLVVDFDNLVYHRLVTNQAEYDLTAYPLTSVAVEGGSMFKCRVSSSPGPAAVGIGYLGYVLLTQDEP